MRHPATQLLLIGSFLVASLALGGCSQRVDIANHDTQALVRAIEHANREPGRHVIRLANRGTYIFTRESEAGLVLPRVGGDLVIQGVGPEIPGYRDRPRARLQIEARSPPAPVGRPGRGPRRRPDRRPLAEGADGAGGNCGTRRLDRVGIVDSTGAARSAIVLNHGTISARDSEIAYNHLALARRDAGTVLNYGQIEFERTSIHDNRAQGRSPDQAVAGGVLNFGSLRVDGLALQDNLADDGRTPLGFAGVLNLGNGSVVGDLGKGAIRDARIIAAAH